jgi:hypothetical protein
VLLTPISDGIIALTNAAGDDFYQLDFGGVTGDFPALRRNTNFLQVRLADNSANTLIEADSIRLTVGTPTAGDVWTATDGNGNGNWAAPANTSPWENIITAGLTQLVTGTDEVLIASTLQIGDYNASQQNLLHIEQTVSTEPTDVDTFVGIKTNLTANYPSTSSNFTLIGNETNLSTGSSFDNTAGVSSVLTAVSGITRYNAVAADTIENVQGGSFISLLTGDGTITYGDGLRARAGISGGTGTVINARALVARTPSGATGAITNAYGLYIEDQKTAQVTNPFQIYSTGAAPSILRSTAAAIIPLTLKVPDAQSTNTFLIENETGTDLFVVNSAGVITTGGYQGTAIGDSYISSAATWNSKQDGDATLTALATYNTNGLMTQTAADTFTGRTLTGTSNEIAVTDGDGVAGNPTVALASVLNLSSKTVRVPNSTTLPATCTVGDSYMDTDATSGSRWYLCESTDTWILQGNAGLSGLVADAVQYAVNTSTLGATSIIRVDTNTYDQRNSTNAQGYRIYGTYTDGSNYVRGNLSATTTTINLVAETAGTGADDVSVNITAAGTGTINLNSPIRGLQDITASTAGSGAPNVLTSAQSRSGWTNEGSTAENYHTLPTAAVGLTYTFCTQDVDGLRVTANTGDTIRISAGVTATAGYINSVDIGSCVVLVAINTTEWFATSSTGTWTIN